MDSCGCDDYASPIDAGTARADRASYHANGPDQTTGARSAVLVEASPDYLDAAREEAQQADLLDRIEIVAGDFVRRAADIDEADIVTLDRVVCCYPDADELVSASAAHAKKLCGLVLPRDRWYVRWALRLDNVKYWLKRSAYRAYAHANTGIDEQLTAVGLRPCAEETTLFWRVVLYTRDEAGDSHPA